MIELSYKIIKLTRTASCNSKRIITRAMHRAKDTGFLLKVVDTVNKRLGFSVNVEKLSTRKQRSMATFVGVMRIEAKKQPYAPETYAPDGKPYHNPVDCSGHQHSNIIDIDSLNEKNEVLVYAALTTSPWPLNSVSPMLISKKTFTGQNKNQYGHIYNTGRWIHINRLKLSSELQKEMENNVEYKPFLDAIIKGAGLAGPAAIGNPILIDGLAK